MTNLSPPILRRATDQDAEGMHRAHMKSIQEICSKDHSVDEIKAWGHRPFDEKKYKHTGDDLIWVIEKEQKIEGYAHLDLFKKDGEKKAYLRGLYFTRAVLGFGLGKELVKRMIDASRKYSANKITLHSTITAHTFYQKCGFVDSAPMQTMEISGQAVRCFPMEMKL